MHCSGFISQNTNHATKNNTVHGKILVGEKIGEFGESLTIHQIFTRQYLQVYGEILSYQKSRTTKVF